MIITTNRGDIEIARAITAEGDGVRIEFLSGKPFNRLTPHELLDVYHTLGLFIKKLESEEK